VRSDASSPSPNGPASENNPHPNPYSSGSDHQLFARGNDDGLLVPLKEQPYPYKEWAAKQKPKHNQQSPYEFSAATNEEETHIKAWEAQVKRQREFDQAVELHDKDGLAKIEEWNKLTQAERDLKDLASAKEVIERDGAARVKKTEEKMAVLEKDIETAQLARDKERAELDDKVKTMKDKEAAKSAQKSGDSPAGPSPVDKRSGLTDTPAAPPVDKDAEEKAKVEAERKFAEKLAADKATADNIKKEAEAKLAAEKEEVKKAEQAAADKLAAEKEAAKSEKQKIDDKLAEQKEDDKADPEKLSADKETAKIEKQKADEKLAEEKTAAEEAKKTAEAQLAAEKKEAKKEEKDAATKLKEEKEAAEKEEKAEKLKGHFDSNKHGVERVAKPKGCSCFEFFSRALGFETKTSGPLDKFRLEFWAVRNRKCIAYCTHPFSGSEFASYRDSMKGKLAVPEKLPEHLYIEAGMSSSSHEKREENATPHGAVTTAEEFRRLRADIDEVREVQANITDSAPEKAEKAESKDEAPALQEHDVKSTGTKLLSAIFPSAFPKAPKAPKANGKDGKAVTDPKAAYNELHAAYNLWLVEFKNSLKNQRAAFKGDRKALAQLEKQAVKVLEDAEKNFVKASEEAAAAAAVDMRKEAFKELTDKAKAKTFKELTGKVKAKADPKPAQVGVVKVMVAKEKSAAAADNALEGVAAAGKAPIHLENAGTGIIPPA
jgi:hypothetical protein